MMNHKNARAQKFQLYLFKLKIMCNTKNPFRHLLEHRSDGPLDETVEETRDVWGINNKKKKMKKIRTDKLPEVPIFFPS